MRKLCPNCEELLKPNSTWRGALQRLRLVRPLVQAAGEPSLPATPPKMPYVSIDIETTGLDPEHCQTLEVGAVIDDWKSPIDQLPRFRRVLTYETVSGNPYAMALNANLLKFMANAPKDPPQPAHEAVATWAEKCGITAERQTPLTAMIGTIKERPIDWYIWTSRTCCSPVDSCRRVRSDELLDLAANPPGISCFCQPDELLLLVPDWIGAERP